MEAALKRAGCEKLDLRRRGLSIMRAVYGRRINSARVIWCCFASVFLMEALYYGLDRLRLGFPEAYVVPAAFARGTASAGQPLLQNSAVPDSCMGAPSSLGLSGVLTPSAAAAARPAVSGRGPLLLLLGKRQSSRRLFASLKGLVRLWMVRDAALRTADSGPSWPSKSTIGRWTDTWIAFLEGGCTHLALKNVVGATRRRRARCEWTRNGEGSRLKLLEKVAKTVHACDLNASPD